MDEELAYFTIRAIDEQKTFIDRIFEIPLGGLTSQVDMREIARGLPLPLHPGAERYYREKGYL